MNVGDSWWAVTSNVHTQNKHTVLAAWIVVIQTLHWRLGRLGLGGIGLYCRGKTVSVVKHLNKFGTVFG